MKTKRKMNGIGAGRLAQLNIQEMSFMLLALVLFFVLVGLFYLVMTSGSMKKDASQLAENKAKTAAAMLADSPEFYCGTSSQICVDADKLLFLKESAAFGKFWGLEGLVVRKVYPAEGSEDMGEDEECGLSNYDKCRTFTIKAIPAETESYSGVSSFIKLCRKEAVQGFSYDKCEIGRIEAYFKK